MRSRPQQYRRVITHLDVVSVAKLSCLFFVVVGLIWLAAGVILWNVIAAFGWIDKVEGLIGNLATGSFRLQSGSVLRGGLIIIIAFVLAATLFTTLLAVIFNLISDVVGGIGFRVEDRGIDDRGEPPAVFTKRERSQPTKTKKAVAAKKAQPPDGTKPGPQKAKPAAKTGASKRTTTGRPPAAAKAGSGSPSKKQPAAKQPAAKQPTSQSSEKPLKQAPTKTRVKTPGDARGKPKSTTAKKSSSGTKKPAPNSSKSTKTGQTKQRSRNASGEQSKQGSGRNTKSKNASGSKAKPPPKSAPAETAASRGKHEKDSR